jgi:hypothetical protein
MRQAKSTSNGRLRRVAMLAAGSALALSMPAIAVRAQTATPPPNSGPPPATSQWQTSPFHGVIGGDGKVIPCRCLFRGTAYRLGEKVCMNTPQGTVMTECDLQQNNTSWVPTSEPCTIS